MIIGIPKEIKNKEQRVSMTPFGVQELIKDGHIVLVQKDAGIGSGFSDSEYEQVGAKLSEDATEVWAADMVIKVKEPLESEYHYFRKDLILFTYLHLAAVETLTNALLKSGTTAIAYEMVKTKDNRFPLLAPMSEVAGKLGALFATNLLAVDFGILLSGVTGVERAKATVLGGGIAGVNSAQLLIGLGAQVTIIDNNIERLRYLGEVFGDKITTLYSNHKNIEDVALNSNIIIGSVLVPGRQSPYLVSEDLVKRMKKGTVLVDIAIDQGGCFETSRPTTHDEPTFVLHDVIHYSVANMPGIVPKTSTKALTNATLKYIKGLANNSLEKAVEIYPEMASAISTFEGNLTCPEVSHTFKIPHKNYWDLVKSNI